VPCRLGVEPRLLLRDRGVLGLDLVEQHGVDEVIAHCLEPSVGVELHQSRD
jgi:hypothetical protein